MTKVFNPSDSVVAHNINGTIYNIAPGETIEVKDSDSYDLLHTLGFLMEVGSNEATEGTIVVNKDDNTTEEKTISVEEAKAQFTDKKVFGCDLTIKKKNEATGLIETIPCGYSSKSKRALIAHQKADHCQPGKPADDSTACEEDIDNEPAKPRGRPRKVESVE